ncbi:MAG: B12-binding domain-containing radical SAM protein, partial [Chlorobium sp.]
MSTSPSDNFSSPLDLTADLSEKPLHQFPVVLKSKKRWLLIQPVSNTSMMVDSGTVSMPLNLIMVASMVGKQFDVTFIDERLGSKVPEDFSGFDVVAITSRTLNASRAYQIGDAALAQGRIVILGGVHPTMLHDEAAAHCTSVVYGEIESIWTELAQDVMSGRMQSIYRTKELKPMSAMIHPDFSYALSSKNAKKYSSRIPLLATKGCPVGCNFCTTPTVYGKSYRYRELDLVLDEMRYHQER